MGDWRKSTYSSANGGQCVEVATDGTVLIRDTTDRAGVMLSVSGAAWTAFLATLLDTSSRKGSPAIRPGLFCCARPGHPTAPPPKRLR